MEKEGCPQGTRPLPATPCRRLLGTSMTLSPSLPPVAAWKDRLSGSVQRRPPPPPALETRSWALSCVSAL